DRWFDYGLDRRKLEATFTENIAVCRKVLARYGKKWANPEMWLDIARNASSELPRRAGKWLMPDPWSFLAGVAMQCGRWKLAERAIGELLALDYGRKYHTKIAHCLRKQMSKLQ